MLDRKALQALGCWTGYRLERVEWPQGDSRTLSLYLKPVSQIMYCEQCGARFVEGINNTIKVIKRRAYGYRDEQYFFLKIRAAFPGIPR